MDPDWLATLSTKDYLFPLAWPGDVWLVNLAYAPLIVWLYKAAPRRRRGRPGRTRPRGWLSVAPDHLRARPALQPGQGCAGGAASDAAHLLDARFPGDDVPVWGTGRRHGDGAAPCPAGRRRDRARIVGAWLVRAVREVSRTSCRRTAVPDNDWGRTMAWARNTPPDSGWLRGSDARRPLRHGLRVAGEQRLRRAVKDTAIGMYDATSPVRTRDRIAAVGDFAALTPARARTLGAQSSLDSSFARTAARPAARLPERKAQGVSTEMSRDSGLGLGAPDSDSGLGTRGSGLGVRGSGLRIRA